MRFPADIQGCMKDCILAVMWPRDEIVAFFQGHGCTDSELSGVRAFKEAQLTRSAIVDRVFASLNDRTDAGLGPFRAMLQSLLTWSHFDPYYFDKLGKLDRGVADKALGHLRQLQEIRHAKLKEETRAREARQVADQQPERTLAQLRTDFLALHSGALPPPQRGYSLQDILLGAAKLGQLEVTEPFCVRGEQIDGAIKYDGEHYLVEAKWQDKAASNEPVYQFAGKVEGKMYGRGLFVSINGFSDNVVRSLVVGKAIKTILIDGEDIVLALEGQLTFRQLIDRKVKAAQTKGLVYIHPLTNAPKVM